MFSCFSGLCQDTTNPFEARCVRPFTISSSVVKCSPDARLYRDQTLTRTPGGRSITTEQIPFSKLKTYIQNEMTSDVMMRSLNDHSNTETTKIIQNMYITSLGGLNLNTIKNYKINLFLNATIDLPIINFPKITATTLRIPIIEKEAELLNFYLSDVADRVHENYLKNGNTLIYCHDGALNSVALAIGYLLKFTDLQYSEAILHMRYTRKGFDLANGKLGNYKEWIDVLARKMSKYDFSHDDDSNKKYNNDIDNNSSNNPPIDQSRSSDKNKSRKSNERSSSKK